METSPGSVRRVTIDVAHPAALMNVVSFEIFKFMIFLVFLNLCAGGRINF